MQTLEQRLRRFSEHETNLKDFIEGDEAFCNDLHFVSLELNNNNQFFDEKLFFSCNSFSFLAKLFAFYIEIIHRTANGADEDMDLHTGQMRDLFEIVFRLVQRSMKISECFLAHGMIKTILKIFDNQKAVSLGVATL